MGSIKGEVIDLGDETARALRHDVRTASRIDEEVFTLRDIGFFNAVWTPIHLGKDTSWRQELESVPQANLGAMLCNLFKRTVGDLETFRFCTKTDNSLNFFWVVWFRRDNEKSREEIWGDAVGSHNVASSAHDGITSVGSEDNDRGDGRFKGAVEIGKAFNIKHVDLQMLALPSPHREADNVCR